MRAICIIIFGLFVASTAAAEAKLDASKRYKGLNDGDFEKIFGTTSFSEWTVDGKYLRRFIGSTRLSYKDDPAGLLADLRDFIGIGAEQLRLSRRVESPTATHFEFQQLAGGKPLENATLSFDLDRGGALVNLVSAIGPERLTLARSILSAQAAECFAADDLLAENGDCSTDPPRKPAGAESLTFETSVIAYLVDGRAQESWNVIITSMQPRLIRRYVIDGRSGTVLEWRDRSYQFDGRGKIFNPNPISNGTSITPDTVPANAYEPCVLAGLKTPSSGAFTLTGDYVKITDVAVDALFGAHITSSQNGVFEFDRGNVDFASVMLYFHIDAIQRYVQSLGFDRIARDQIEVDPQVSTELNATFWDGQLLFGAQIVPTVFAAEDGDVIAHEYAHVLQYSQLGDLLGGPGEAGAMREGFADYWAMSHFDDPNRIRRIPPECYGDWIGQVQGKLCERSIFFTANRDDFRDDAKPHDNGVIWAATLWEIRQLLGRKEADSLILESHFNVRRPEQPTSKPRGRTIIPADFESGARAIIAADRTRNESRNTAALCGIFSRRRLMGETTCLAIRASVQTLTPGM